MEAPTVLMPGDAVPSSMLPEKAKSSKPLNLGPGLRQSDTHLVAATAGGSLSTDKRKNVAWLETNGTGRVSIYDDKTVIKLFSFAKIRGKYIPAVGDLVIAVVHHHAAEFFHCSITPHTYYAMLPQLAFEGANKKTRPSLQSGSLVYARVASASRHTEPEIECVYPSTSKANGLGELKGGMLFDISLAMSRRLLMKNPREDGQVAVLEELGEKGVRFEIAVGRNGRIWVNGEDVKTTLIVGRAIQETDQKQLTVNEQLKLVRKAVK